MNQSNKITNKRSAPEPEVPERDIVLHYDPTTWDIRFRIADRDEVTFDHQDITKQLNDLDLGCVFSTSEVEEWTANAESLLEALECVLNLAAMKFAIREGMAISYVDEMGRTRYAATLKGAQFAGGRRLAS